MKKTFLLALTMVCLMLTASAQKKPFFFVQISDPQFGMFDENKSFTKETANMEQTIEAINRLKPAFVVITGDMVHNGESSEQIAEMKRCLTLFDKKIPVYLVPGNHDVGAQASPERVSKFIADYGADRFAFGYKNCYVIGINTEIISSKQPEAEQEQYLWLLKELKKAQKYKYRIVVGHRPLFIDKPDEADKYDNVPLEYRGKYFDLYKSAGVTMLLWGHLHANRNGLYDGIIQIISTAVGKPLGSKPVSGMQIVKVYPDHIDAEFHELGKYPDKVTF